MTIQELQAGIEAIERRAAVEIKKLRYRNEKIIKMKSLHNTVFPGHVTGNMYEYRGVGIFQHGTRYRIDFATGNKWVSSLEWAKRVIDSVLKHQ